ncbi:hypothetical protein [Methylobacterium sp. Gmos1]
MRRLIFPALLLAIVIAAFVGERLYRADPIVMLRETIGDPCDGYRLASESAYKRIALDLVFPTLQANSVFFLDATQERVDRQLERIADLRSNYLPHIKDKCVALHAAGYINYYEYEAKSAMAKRADFIARSERLQKKSKQEDEEARSLRSAIAAKTGEMEAPRDR